MRILVLFVLTLLQCVSLSLAGVVTLEWDPSPDPEVIGYNLYYGGLTQQYTNLVVAGSSTKVTVENLTDGIPYYFAATSVNFVGLESEYSSELTYLMPSVPGLIQLTGVDRIYDGLPKLVTVDTTPPGLSVLVTYNGLLDPPVHPGSYDVTAVVLSPLYIGTISVVLTISKANLPIALGNLNQVYDGTPKPVSVSTGPVTAPVLVTYDGQLDPPVAAGTYLVDSSVVAASDYTGHNSAFLTISKATAGIQLTNLARSFDGVPKPVSFTTDPPGLHTIVTYEDSLQVPSVPGIYRIVATIDNPNYQGSATGLLSILPGNSLPRIPTGPNLPEVAPIEANSTAAALVLSWSPAVFPVTIWRSANLSLWTPFASEPGGSNFLVMSNASPHLFFRATSSTPDAVIPLRLSLEKP